MQLQNHKTMKVSIIVPVYNIAPYLERSLSSCVNQTFKDIEIVVVNDGSTDSSPQIIRKYAAKDDRIVVVNKQNEGLIYARRSGIEIARSEYIFHLDGDDFIPDTAIEYLYREVAHNPELDMVFGDCYMVKDNKFNLYRYYDISTEMVEQSLLYELMDMPPRWSVWGKLMRKTLYNDIIYKPVAVGEDLYQMIQLVPKVKTMSVIHSCVYYYQYARVGSIMNNQNKEEQSTRILHLAESIYSIMSDYPYEKRVEEAMSVYILNLLCVHCHYKEADRARLIVKQEFLQKREFRRLLWKKHKFLYIKCCMYLFSPQLCNVVVKIIKHTLLN